MGTPEVEDASAGREGIVLSKDSHAFVIGISRRSVTSPTGFREAEPILRYTPVGRRL